MAYTDFNFKTKKALKEAFLTGKKIHCHHPGGIFPLRAPGRVALEGPHGNHKWYADVEVDADGYITRIYG